MSASFAYISITPAMMQAWPTWAIITWISFCCGFADSFLFVNLKNDPSTSILPRISPVLSMRIRSNPSVLSSTIESSASGETSTRESLAKEASSTANSEETSSRTHKVDFVSPLLDYGYPPAVRDLKLRQDKNESEKPILLYLPGFDGTYICPFIQFPELGTEFEVWCMTIGMEDRSTYNELKNIVLDFVKKDLIGEEGKQPSVSPNGNAETNGETPQKNNGDEDNVGFFGGFFGGNTKKVAPKKNGRPIYIAGESFGGILASDVALALLKEQTKKNNDAVVDLQGMVLINPATCYDRSQLATAGPPVAKTPILFYLLALFSKLVPLFTDEFSVEQLLLILQAKGLPSVIDNPQREAYMGRVALSLPTKLEFMPPSTLDWRLNEWLATGCAASRDFSFAGFPSFRSLIVVGEKDKTLPAIDEAERLANKVTNPSKTRIHVVDGAGHASTCGSRLDLAAVMRKSFPELQTTQGGRWRKGKRSNANDNDSVDSNLADEIMHEKRTSMKPEAQEGFGPYFGITERYDKADIGLNPLLYWAKSNFQAVQAQSQERTVQVPNTPDPVTYKKTVYTVSD